MAADPQPDWLSCLPSSWSYGVTRDGRIFFINEEAKSTTWLHPVTGEAVITGHRKTPDLPTGWEEGYTFEGARCFINHNERKVTCKHPVSGFPSQDNCIFVVNEQHPNSLHSSSINVFKQPSRSSRKVHNFGKRSNSIKRNPNAPVVRSSWLYKQDSTGMKLWKKRWFVLSDMCLFYYRDEKEDSILGSILLPSFHISMLSVDDHISRKYAFKATHPNMRTYYFCTDTAKEMESWMKVMTDAALVHTEPVRRTDKLKGDQRRPQELNNLLNHRVLTRPEIQNNERNREPADAEKCATVCDKYGFQRDPSTDRALTKINSIKLQPAQAAAIAAAVSASRQNQANISAQKPAQVSGSGCGTGEQQRDCSPTEVDGNLARVPVKSPAPVQEPEKGLSRTNSIQQLEHWVHPQRRGMDDNPKSVTSYQTLPRNMPSHRTQIVPRYPQGYRTLPRNSMMRPESICSVAGSVYDRALHPACTSAVSTTEKRKSMRDDTMWQLYEWQQRQAFSRQSVGHYGTLPSIKTMGNISQHAVAHSIPTSPSHGSLALYSTFSPSRQQVAQNHSSSHSEVSSPILRGDVTLDRRHRTHLAKYGYTADRRSIAVGIASQTITPQSLQGKTTSSDDYKDGAFVQRPEEADIDTKLSRLCEQDKAVRMQEEKLQQLHREKHTLETALLSASQELSEQSDSNAAATQSLVQQRDVLQNGLLSTCRELSRVSTELECSWREYDLLEADVTLAKSNLLEQLEALGSPQPPSQRHIQIQKELWRIQDVMEALSKSKPQRSTNSSFLGSKPLSIQQKNEQAPDYRLYKSEPELTTVNEEVDEANGEEKDKAETESKDGASSKVGVIPPRTKSPMSPAESSTIASYVTLRKTKKPESRSDRPKSAVDQIGFGEREVGRTRMSVEEQLDRLRRNQEALLLREKKKETPTRSPSFSKDNPFLILQVCLSHTRFSSDVTSAEMPTAEEVKNDKCEEVKQDGNTGLKSVEEPQVTMGRLDHEVLFYFSGQLCVADSSVKIVNTVY
uniref:Pleckstrin homology domain containing, family A member 5 n=1 Tax=Astatotilapia calliptera TaxID=8154 RepID=A0A3P8PWX4_ASTCA